MSKRPSLFGAAAPEKPAAVASPPAPAAPQAAAEPTTGRKYPVAKTREGKRVATVYLEPEALKQLQRLAIDEDRSIQDLLVEGINAVFEARGQSRIA